MIMFFQSFFMGVFSCTSVLFTGYIQRKEKNNFQKCSEKIKQKKKQSNDIQNTRAAVNALYANHANKHDVQFGLEYAGNA